MSTSDELWDALAQRVAVSRVSGVTAEDDDMLRSAELGEAALNPNRAANSAAPGLGGPGMMPPMMMGGMGGAGAQGGAGGGSLGGAPAAAGSAVPAGPPMTGAAPLTAAPMSSSGPSSSSGIPSVSSGGGGFSGGSMPSGSLGGGGAKLGGLGGGAPEVEPEPPVDTPPTGSIDTVGTPRPPGGEGPLADGFAVDPAQLKSLADRWAALAQSFEAPPVQPDTALGLVKLAERPHQALAQQLGLWSKGAAEEFDAMVGRLHDAGAGYQTADDEGVSSLRQAGATA